MKRFLLIACSALALASCGNPATDATAPAADTTATEAPVVDSTAPAADTTAAAPAL